MLDPSKPRRVRAVAYKSATFIALATVTLLLLSMLGRYFWPFDLLTHLRVHYVVALAVSAAVLALTREWRGALLAACAAVYVAIPTFEYLQPSRSMTTPDATRVLRAQSINVWFRNGDLHELAGYIEASAVDVVVLQELTEMRARELAVLLPSFAHTYLESAHLTDSVLFSKWPINEVKVVQLTRDGTSAMAASLQWRDRPIHVMGVHLHWPLGPRDAARRNGELAGIAALAQAQREPLLVLGDLNVTPWSSHFTNTLAAARLRDCSAGKGLQPTWPSHAVLLGIRIDHCLVSAHWRAVDAWTGPHLGSDHRPVGVALELN